MSLLNWLPVNSQVQNGLPEGRVFLGMYDPEGRFANSSLDVDHYFINWTDTAGLTTAIERSIGNNRVPYITFEAWSTVSGIPTNVLQDTQNRVNDQIILPIAEILNSYKPQLILVGIFHEAELVGLYPWSQSDVGAFIGAFRRFVDLVRFAGADNVRFVFSPAGNNEAVLYYPGTEYTDAISITVLASPDWDARGGLRPQSFAPLYQARYGVLNQFNKPLIVREFGVTRQSPEELALFMDEALDYLREIRQPNLIGVVYHNAINAPNIWTNDRPDWRVSPDGFWEPSDMPPLLGPGMQ